jgi:hypothetical protein
MVGDKYKITKRYIKWYLQTFGGGNFTEPGEIATVTEVKEDTMCFTTKAAWFTLSKEQAATLLTKVNK